MESVKECTVFDLRTAQLYQDRGIPRYMRNLLLQITKDYPTGNFYFLLDRALPMPSFYEAFKAYGRFFFTEEGSTLFTKTRIVNYFISFFPLELDTPSSPRTLFFESLYPPFLYGHAPKILGMIWDFIPLIFYKHYIDLKQKSLFMNAYTAMREADHLFAISNQTANDAVQLLNISPDKITNIYGGICGEIVEALKTTPAQEEILTFSFGSFSRERYFVYVAGNEWRKNIPRLIEAYGILSKTKKDGIKYPLIIICSMTADALKHNRALILAAGLNPNRDLIVSGYVSDKDLVRLLKNTKGQIFPSFYEGLGLPILESYACGTPVIASGTSSLSELVPQQCSFDPYDPKAIAEKIDQFSRDPSLKKISLEFGANILKTITWENASALIIAQLKSPGVRKASSFASKISSEVLPIFTILPPDNSGIAEYSFAIFKEAPWDIHFYHHFPSLKTAMEFNEQNNIPGYHPKLFSMCHKIYNYRKAIFVLGNSHHHIHTLRALLDDPALFDGEKFLYLHDIQIVHLLFAYCNYDLSLLKRFLAEHYPEKANEIEEGNSVDDIIENTHISGTRSLVQLSKAKNILVQSNEAKELLLQDLEKYNLEVKCEILFLPIIEQKVSRSPTIKSSAEVTIGHFGILGAAKHPHILIEACSLLQKHFPLKLIFAGYHLKESLKHLKYQIPPFVQLIDSPSHEELINAMQQIDVAVQLRWPTTGGPSGVVNQLLSLNKPVITTDRGCFKEYNDCVVLTPEGISASQLALVIEHTLKNKEGLSENISRFKKALSLEAYYERFQKILIS